MWLLSVVQKTQASLRSVLAVLAVNKRERSPLAKSREATSTFDFYVVFFGCLMLIKQSFLKNETEGNFQTSL